jgi:hypothetical protein
MITGLGSLPLSGLLGQVLELVWIPMLEDHDPGTPIVKGRDPRRRLDEAALPS